MLIRIEQLITDLAAQINRCKRRSLDRYLESGSEQDRTEAQRARGAEYALEELRRRVHALDPNCPEWLKPSLEPQDLDFRPLSAAVEHPDSSAAFRRPRRRA